MGIEDFLACLSQRCPEPEQQVSKVVIDASNLRVGGGVQVASAFVQDLLTRRLGGDAQYTWLPAVQFNLSVEVRENLPRHLQKELSRYNFQYSEPDLQFVVFGPRYARLRAKRVVAGFADVTSIYGDHHMKIHDRAKRLIRRQMSLDFFKRVDHVIVETGAVRERLANAGVQPTEISVVPNTWHPVFNSYAKRDIGTPYQPDREITSPRLLYVARAYPHKNHDFLGEVAEDFEYLTGRPLTIQVTLTEREWSKRTEKFRRSAENLGPLASEQLPTAYEAADLVVFPSLLECFSATPLESMVMKKPLIASDRDFVRTVCGEAAEYFDPTSVRQAVHSIHKVANDADYREALTARGRAVVSRWPSNTSRSSQYLAIIDRQLACEPK